MGYRYFLDIKSKTESLTYEGPNNPIPNINDSELTEEQLASLHIATWKSLHACLRRKQAEDKTFEFVRWGIYDIDTMLKIYESDVLTEYVGAV